MDEGIGNHLHLIHITNDFAYLGCYKLLHEIWGSNGDTYACDAVHLNDIVWAVDFCNQGAQARERIVTVNDLQYLRACFLAREVSLHEEPAFAQLHGEVCIIFESV